ncbi:hypothetical protein BASA50_009817 [Batrachochytrium salamandrivorans]|uniref:Uncharacterized protein n=1 Tax=Batrachochytrium salamandrivorans TaxID=1357716 RepID=A0ABQ8F0K2_9FUNG|nr:hypothetical protein BASA60_011241 [Batrachochytrium salamandrivorans]KAH6589725.1 hypothetical protein BASA50_009817 [Batrachochytrium salamandrivorans]KAH9247887.1 hypothetical protein BASA81_014484 [Batrachochytrium salamandrivorans]KAJ1336529.1 hypothetical protein BSLG_007313 [Batrachochytrium salamandrivorans]
MSSDGQEHTVTSLLSMLSGMTAPPQAPANTDTAYENTQAQRIQPNVPDLSWGTFTPNLVEDVRRTFLNQLHQQLLQQQQPQLQDVQQILQPSNPYSQTYAQPLQQPPQPCIPQQQHQQQQHQQQQHQQQQQQQQPNVYLTNQPALQDSPREQQGYQQQCPQTFPSPSQFLLLVQDLMRSQGELETKLLDEREKFVKMLNDRRRELDAQEIIGKITEKQTRDEEAMFEKDLRKFDLGIFGKLEDMRRKQQEIMQKANMPGFKVTEDQSLIAYQIWCLAPFVLISSSSQ